jgi:L-aspartate oxidase
MFAYELGAKISGMDLIQFHPTAFDGGETPGLLITEAVRGEGAYLLNERMERFCDELAPRDVVSRAMTEQGGRLWLDLTHLPSPELRFPMIHSRLLALGCDFTREPVPVYPCQHYLTGGIETDSCGRTDITGLYAIGECAYTGVHGANRLASNSLLESLVFARRCAEAVSSSAPFLQQTQQV